MEKNLTEEIELRDGYDLPVYGLDNGLFYALHIPAMSCILISLSCAITAIVLSFRRQPQRSFFSWTKCDRFVVYLALCDGLFNTVHICDHLQMTITKDHVYPKELCQTYGFFIIVFISSQNLMVNIVAINIFMIMYFNKQLKFGKWDWKLLFWTFGVPFSGAVIAANLGQFGTAGAFCFFDGVNGNIGNLVFTTVPLLIILAMNILLYILTWTKIRRETRFIQQNLGQNHQSRKATIKAARSMSLFVVAFFIQWCSAGIYGAWGLFGTVPIALFHAVTTFNNIGGIMNLIVYFIVHRKEIARKHNRSSMYAKDQRQESSVRTQSSDLPTTAAASAYPD